MDDKNKKKEPTSLAEKRKQKKRLEAKHNQPMEQRVLDLENQLDKMVGMYIDLDRRFQEQNNSLHKLLRILKEEFKG